MGHGVSDPTTSPAASCPGTTEPGPAPAADDRRCRRRCSCRCGRSRRHGSARAPRRGPGSGTRRSTTSTLPSPGRTVHGFIVSLLQITRRHLTAPKVEAGDHLAAQHDHQDQDRARRSGVAAAVMLPHCVPYIPVNSLKAHRSRLGVRCGSGSARTGTRSTTGRWSVRWPWRRPAEAAAR